MNVVNFSCVLATRSLALAEPWRWKGTELTGEGQLRGGDIRGMANFKEATKDLSLGPGLVGA